jgi:hypothetical protein
VLPDNRVRRFGSLGLSVSYQPAPWFIASLQGSTSVCYNLPSGGQSVFGGCAGGLTSSSFWTRNPIANKFSNVGLQFTIPIDALYETIRSSDGEKQTAKARDHKRL